MTTSEAAWQEEIALRVQDLDENKAKTVTWTEVRDQLSGKTPAWLSQSEFHWAAAAELESAFDWYLEKMCKWRPDFWMK